MTRSYLSIVQFFIFCALKIYFPWDSHCLCKWTLLLHPRCGRKENFRLYSTLWPLILAKERPEWLIPDIQRFMSGSLKGMWECPTLGLWSYSLAPRLWKAVVTSSKVCVPNQACITVGNTKALSWSKWEFLQLMLITPNPWPTRRPQRAICPALPPPPPPPRVVGHHLWLPC